MCGYAAEKEASDGTIGLFRGGLFCSQGCLTSPQSAETLPLAFAFGYGASGQDAEIVEISLERVSR